jgi:hypothetical protein
MLPKNKLRNIRLSRLKIFEEGNAGPFMANVIQRYDNIVIPPHPKKKTLDQPPEEVTTNLLKDALPDAVTSTKAKRQDDTPALGSLGGLKPLTIYTPKVKVPKVRNKKPAPGMMKIFDSQGRQWGRQKWKETDKKSKIEVEVR